MNDLTKAVFETHIDGKGRLQDGKEKFDCPHCGGECFIKYESISPGGGVQLFENECTDCGKIWEESF